ncbi:MAG TPA: hypothetical protein VJI13_05800 [Candidatus Norongarragalinales archaeon]|nr:hypothetical protein [Candidatus Norongarragalinales archaeon]
MKTIAIILIILAIGTASVLYGTAEADYQFRKANPDNFEFCEQDSDCRVNLPCFCPIATNRKAPFPTYAACEETCQRKSFIAKCENNACIAIENKPPNEKYLSDISYCEQDSDCAVQRACSCCGCPNAINKYHIQDCDTSSCKYVCRMECGLYNGTMCYYNHCAFVQAR